MIVHLHYSEYPDIDRKNLLPMLESIEVPTIPAFGDMITLPFWNPALAGVPGTVGINHLMTSFQVGRAEWVIQSNGEAYITLVLLPLRMV
jgi:hypothetical protein